MSEEEIRALWDKRVKCPVCEQEISTKNVRSRYYTRVGQDTDLRPIYRGLNPILYDIWVCPFCFYASREEDFDKLSEEEKREMIEHIDERAQIAGIQTFPA
ncbi:MAG: DUF2225 domain-containing protein [bacterium]